MRAVAACPRHAAVAGMGSVRNARNTNLGDLEVPVIVLWGREDEATFRNLLIGCNFCLSDF